MEICLSGISFASLYTFRGFGLHEIVIYSADLRVSGRCRVEFVQVLCASSWRCTSPSFCVWRSHALPWHPTWWLTMAWRRKQSGQAEPTTEPWWFWSFLINSKKTNVSFIIRTYEFDSSNSQLRTSITVLFLQMVKIDQGILQINLVNSSVPGFLQAGWGLQPPPQVSTLPLLRRQPWLQTLRTPC